MTYLETSTVESEVDVIHDAKVEVTCDGKDCENFLEIELEYVYYNYSGEDGRYDDSRVTGKIEDKGWRVTSSPTHEDRHYCPDCSKF